MKPDFGRVDERADELREDDPVRQREADLEWLGGTDNNDGPPIGDRVREVVKDHPVAGAAGALTGAVTGTMMGGAPGTVVGAAAGAARGVVVAEGIKKVGEKLQEEHLLDRGGRGAEERQAPHGPQSSDAA